MCPGPRPNQGGLTTEAKITFDEVSIVVIAQNHNPTLLNPDFLKINRIVPSTFELAENPLCTDLVAQVRYKNGLAIQSQPDRVVFSEIVSSTALGKLEIPAMVSQYVRTLPHVEYRAVGLNPTAHRGSASDEKARAFVTDHLIARGPWIEFGDPKPVGAVKLVYNLPGTRLTMAVEAGTKKSSSDPPLPCVFFAGNFHHDLQPIPPRDRIEEICKIVDGWKDEIKTFTDLVETRFLSEKGVPA